MKHRLVVGLTTKTHLVVVIHNFPVQSTVFTLACDREEALRNAKALSETDDRIRVSVLRADDGQCIATFPDPNTPRPKPGPSPDRAPFDPQPTPLLTTA